MKSKLQILLTGASGSVGLEVLKKLILLGEKYNITTFDVKSKQTHRILAPYVKDVKQIFGDISKIDDIRPAIPGVDVVIHLAAVIPPLADEKPDLAWQVNTQGTENLVRLMEQYSPGAFLFYSSSISVYGDRTVNPMIRVSDIVAPSIGDHYAVTKIKAEQIIRESKIDWSIFRLTAIMGKHKISKLMFHMPLDTPLEICTSEDAGRAFSLAIEYRNHFSGKAFNLGGGINCRISYRDFLQRSFKEMGLGKLNFPLKAFAEKNFHCGYYADGDDLENIIHFRKDSLNDYFSKVKRSTPVYKKFITSIFKKQVKNYLLKKSEPFQAFTSGDTEMIQHYFKDSE